MDRVRTIRRLKTLGPWLVGLAIVVAVATRVPLSAFRGTLGAGPHHLLITVDVLVVLVTLCVDAVSTKVGLGAVGIGRPLFEIFAARGVSYLLSIVNYAAGQGGFGYYLKRTGVPALTAAGATLFLMGTTLATLLLLTTTTWTLYGGRDAFWWTLVAGCGAFVVYLAAIALRPARLAEKRILAPLFDAGLRGHAMALIARLPHVSMMVIGIWLAMRVWGIPVPFATGMALVPVVVIASVLPISPAGLGTTQAAMVYFFSDFAAGATAGERAAGVLAFSVVHFVYALLGFVLAGLLCVPLARRAQLDAAGSAP